MKLIALRCPRCAQPLSANGRDIIVQCANCHAAVVIADGGLALIEVVYAAPQGTPTSWVPLWRFDGRVNIGLREVQNSAISLNRWMSANSSENFWSRASHYYVPAWDLPLEQASQMARELLESQPQLAQIERPANALFNPVIFTAEDARKLLELIIVTVEARRSDWLKDLNFSMEMAAPTLWILPAKESNGTWQLVADNK